MTPNSPRRSASPLLLSAILLLATAFLGAAGAHATAPPPLPQGAPRAADAATSPTALSRVLAALNTSRAELEPDTIALLLRKSSSDAPPISQRLLLRPFDGPYVAAHVAGQHRYWADSITMTFLHASGRTDAEVARGYIGNPLREGDARLLAAEDPLLEAVRELAAAAPGDVSQSFDEDSVRKVSRELDPLWRLEIARLLFAQASCARFEQRAFSRAETQPAARALLQRLTPAELIRSAVGGPGSEDLRPLHEAYNMNDIAAGMLDLAMAAEDFRAFLDANPQPPAPSRHAFDTPLGRVVLRLDASNDTLESAAPVHHLLIVDLGGNDRYGEGLSIGGMRWPAQLVIDAAGNDTYATPSLDSCSFGGGVCGASLLLDLAGDDTYVAGLVAQGAGLFGAGMLVDGGGNDSYEAIGIAQGAGVEGIGLLQDRGGNDRYLAWMRAQGLGENSGAGTLFDEDGDDNYTLDNETIRFPAIQDPKSNSSRGQGMGIGMRQDMVDGRSLPGGVGMLYDRRGNDTYSAGVFAQGCGFLGGTGILVDDDGDDSFTAAYYAQGAAAHRAVGILLNAGTGTDSYVCRGQCAQGCGHDYSTGWLADLGGNDSYRAARLAFGSANDNGYGFFLDLSGDDLYEISAAAASADSFGASKVNKWGTLREDSPALGLFLDCGGTDRYPAGFAARNDATWLYPRRQSTLALRSERGAGIDGTFADSGMRVAPLTPEAEGDRRFYADQVKLRRAFRQPQKASPAAPPTAPPKSN